MNLLNDSSSPMPHDVSFYQHALQEIKHDGISSQIYFLLKQQGRLTDTPVFFQNELKESFEKALFQNMLIKNQTELILKLFEREGINVIPLKGIFFAGEIFGHFGARATADIDLLIKPESIEKAINLVKSLGYTNVWEHLPEHFHCSFYKPLPQSPIPLVVELHWNILKENTSKVDINELWAQAKPIAQFLHVKRLSPNHTFYMICLHGWRHNLDSMKYFIDIIQVINKYNEELDYDEIFKLAAAHQTYTRLLRTLSIVYEQFPLLENVKSFPFKKKKNLWEYRLIKGYKQYQDFIDYQFLSYDTIKHSLIEVRDWFCPPRKDILEQIDVNKDHTFYLKILYLLYKKRITGILRTIKAN